MWSIILNFNILSIDQPYRQCDESNKRTVSEYAKISVRSKDPFPLIQQVIKTSHACCTLLTDFP